MGDVADVHAEVRAAGNQKQAEFAARFFKTSPGQYGEGDTFAGLSVPQCRAIARKHRDLSLDQLDELLRSAIHEERLIALLVLIEQFDRADGEDREAIYRFYLDHLAAVNNWDLVDASADKIVGMYLLDKPRDVLYTLVQSASIWERRTAIIATFAFIRQGEYADTLAIAELLLNDRHDLIHKAVGWMLREVGKRCSEEAEVEFLNRHYRRMPRTMLRYAIERFPEEIRRAYLTGRV